MPKRPCPFEDNLLPQLKIHVGQKQVDNGVFHEERMKTIYGMMRLQNDESQTTFIYDAPSFLFTLLCTGKTMDLLKKGMKRLNASMELNSIDVPPSRISSSYKSKHERHSKQMTLNSKLELLAADKTIKVS